MCLFMAICTYLSAQNEQEQYRFKDGIYLNIEDFKANQPSMPLPGLSNANSDPLAGRLCMKNIEYVNNGKVEKINSKDVWGICINGEPYIKHVPFDAQISIASSYCYFKLHHVKSLSLYFVQETVRRNNNWTGNPVPIYAPGEVKVKIREYAVDLRTGITYNLKSEASKIVDLIKEDEYFKDSKIKKKDVMMFITQYNQRHPLELTQ